MGPEYPPAKLRAHSIEQPGRQPVTRSQWNASGQPTGDRPAAGKRPAARRRRLYGFLKIDVAGGQILAFSIDLLRRPYNTLALPSQQIQDGGRPPF